MKSPFSPTLPDPIFGDAREWTTPIQSFSICLPPPPELSPTRSTTSSKPLLLLAWIRRGYLDPVVSPPPSRADPLSTVTGGADLVTFRRWPHGSDDGQGAWVAAGLVDGGSGIRGGSRGGNEGGGRRIWRWGRLKGMERLSFGSCLSKLSSLPSSSTSLPVGVAAAGNRLPVSSAMLPQHPDT